MKNVHLFLAERISYVSKGRFADGQGKFVSVLWLISNKLILVNNGMTYKWCLVRRLWRVTRNILCYLNQEFLTMLFKGCNEDQTREAVITRRSTQNSTLGFIFWTVCFLCGLSRLKWHSVLSEMCRWLKINFKDPNRPVTWHYLFCICKWRTRCNNL